MRGNTKLLNTVAVSALVAVCLFSAPTIARAVTTNLNAGESINLKTVIDNNLSVWIEDKVFETFSWDPTGLDLDTAASNVNLKAISNLNGIGFRLEFQLPMTVGDFDFKHATFQYKVAVTNSSNLISALHLSVDGSSVGGAFWSVSETAHTGGFGGGTVGSVVAASSTYSSSSNNIVPPQAELWIEKDIIAGGTFDEDGFFDDYASISAIEQTFSQIPEPSTMVLVGLGLLGVVAVNRKRKS